MDKTSEHKECSEEQIEIVGGMPNPYIGPDGPHRKDGQEKRLVLKQDFSIVLLLSGCYWFAYLVSSL